VTSSEETHQEITCANCGRRFMGTFCPSCGQEASEPRRPILVYVRQLLGDFFALDARVWTTLGPLFARPGSLTTEWFAGRRVRYVPPFRLYVFAGLVFFAVMAVTGGGPLRIRLVSSEEGYVLTFGGGMGKVSLGPEQEPEADDTPSGSWHGVGRLIEARFDRVREHPDDFNTAVFAALSYVHFLLLPVFALLLKPFWRRRYTIEHLVFATHYQAFVLLFGSVIIAGLTAASGLGPVSAIAKALWQPVVLGYLFLAVRRFYGGRWWTNALKVVVLGWFYVMLAVFTVVGVAVATMALF